MSCKRSRSTTIPMKLFHHPIHTPIQSLTTPRRPNTSTARSTYPLRRNAFYLPCSPDLRSAISSSSPKTTPSGVFPGISLPLHSTHSRTSTAGHQMFFNSLSPTCPEIVKNYFAPKPVLTHCGQRIETNFCESEFNDLNSIDETTEPPLTSTQRAKLKKLKTFGGAIAGYVYIDCYTGKADGILVYSMAKPLPLVKATV